MEEYATKLLKKVDFAIRGKKMSKDDAIAHAMSTYDDVYKKGGAKIRRDKVEAALRNKLDEAIEHTFNADSVVSLIFPNIEYEDAVKISDTIKNYGVKSSGGLRYKDNMLYGELYKGRPLVKLVTYLKSNNINYRLKK